jgi:hypothetical protein
MSTLGFPETTDSKEAEERQPLYEASTQFRNWRFSPEGLEQIREKLNDAAVAAIRNTFEVDQVTLSPIRSAFFWFSSLSFSLDLLLMLHSWTGMRKCYW